MRGIARREFKLKQFTPRKRSLPLRDADTYQRIILAQRCGMDGRSTINELTLAQDGRCGREVTGVVGGARRGAGSLGTRRILSTRKRRRLN